MSKIILYFKIHNELLLNNFKIFDIGFNKQYFDQRLNKNRIEGKIHNSYFKLVDLLLDLSGKFEDKFCFVFLISGMTLKQISDNNYNLIEKLQFLSSKKNVEFLSQTYFNSLSFLKSKNEFVKQIELENKIIFDLFGQKPKSFVNTNFFYSEEILKTLKELNFENLICVKNSSLKKDLENNLFEFDFMLNDNLENMKVLINNLDKSNIFYDNLIFNEKNFDNLVLDFQNDLDKFSCLNLFLNVEKLNFDDNKFFLFKRFLTKLLENNKNKFCLPNQIFYQNSSQIKKLNSDFFLKQNNLSFLNVFLKNQMQISAIDELYELEDKICKIDDLQIYNSWQKLTSAEHIYFMFTKDWNLENKHKKNIPYTCAYHSYLFFKNVLTDLKIKVEQRYEQKIQKEKDLLLTNN